MIQSFGGKNKSKTLIRVIFAGAFILVLGAWGFAAHALTPTLSLYGQSNGDSVQVNINGDPNASVLFYYTKVGVGSQISSLGTTDNSGNLSVTVGSIQYGITSNTPVHVTTGGASGPSSATVAWPTVITATGNTISLSQTSVTVNAGSSTSVTAYNNSSTALSLSSSSNPSIAGISIVNNQITIVGSVPGSTIATFCAHDCVGIAITVQAASTNTQLALSQSSLTLGAGQSASVTISGGTMPYSILSNSNAGAVSATINGSLLNVIASASVSGSAAITVCSYGNASCALLSVNAGGSGSSVPLFSITNPSLTVGQNLAITISGGVGTTYYVSAISAPGIVQPNITGATLTLYGIANGSTTLTVCSYLGGCSTLPVTVSSNSSGIAITLNPNAMTLSTGQTATVTVTGGNGVYTSPTTSTYSSQIGINGATITIYAVNPGSSSFSICSTGVSCATLTVVVNGTNTSVIALSPTSVSLGVGQSATVTISGSGSYYVSNNTNAAVASASISGSNGVVSGVNQGSTTVTICQSTNSQCASLTVTVNATSSGVASISLSSPNQTVQAGNQASFIITQYGFVSPSYSVRDSFAGSTVTSLNLTSYGSFGWTPVTSDIGNHTVTISATDSYGHSAYAIAQITVQGSSSGSSGTGSKYVFTKYLKPGMSGTEVIELQKVLADHGYLTAIPTGYYGAQTTAAVKKLQKAYGLDQLGVVGPATRGVLNQLAGSSNSSSSSSSSSGNASLVDSLSQQLQALQAQLKLLRGY